MTKLIILHGIYLKISKESVTFLSSGFAVTKVLVTGHTVTAQTKLGIPGDVSFVWAAIKVCLSATACGHKAPASNYILNSTLDC